MGKFSIKTSSGFDKKRVEGKGGGGNKYGNRLFIKDDTPLHIQFLGDISSEKYVEYDVHSFRDGSGWHKVPCLGDSCPLCEDERTDVSRTGYGALTNVYVHEQKRVMVLEVPKTLATLIGNRREKMGKAATLEQWQGRVFELTRRSTQPKSYDLVPDPDTTAVDISGAKRNSLDETLQRMAEDFFGADATEVNALVEEQRAATPPWSVDEPEDTSTTGIGDDLDPDGDDLDELDDLDEVAMAADPVASAPAPAKRRR